MTPEHVGMVDGTINYLHVKVLKKLPKLLKIKVSKGGFHSYAIEESFWVPQRTIFFLNMKNILIILRKFSIKNLECNGKVLDGTKYSNKGYKGIPLFLILLFFLKKKSPIFSTKCR